MAAILAIGGCQLARRVCGGTATIPCNPSLQTAVLYTLLGLTLLSTCTSGVQIHGASNVVAVGPNTTLLTGPFRINVPVRSRTTGEAGGQQLLLVLVHQRCPCISDTAGPSCIVAALSCAQRTIHCQQDRKCGVPAVLRILPRQCWHLRPACCRWAHLPHNDVSFCRVQCARWGIQAGD